MEPQAACSEAIRVENNVGDLSQVTAQVVKDRSARDACPLERTGTARIVDLPFGAEQGDSFGRVHRIACDCVADGILGSRARHSPAVAIDTSSRLYCSLPRRGRIHNAGSICAPPFGLDLPHGWIACEGDGTRTR